MKNKAALLLFSLLLCACEQDYDLGNDGNYLPKGVVNSMISPSGPITVDLFWSMHYSEVKDWWTYDNPYPRVEAFALSLWEDGTQLLDGVECIGGKTTMDVVPEEGKKYRIEIEVPDYGKLSAETAIPAKSSCRFKYVKRKGEYMHFSVEGIEAVPDCMAYWIFMRNVYEGQEPENIWELFSINPYVDQLNAFHDSYDAGLKESSIVFEDFIRIPRRNLAAALPLNLSVWLWESKFPHIEWEVGMPIHPREKVKLTHVILDLITPSADFDQYHKTLYRQSEYGRYDSSAPFVFETVHVYTNIQNGLGIFAGYNQNSIAYEVVEE